LPQFGILPLMGEIVHRHLYERSPRNGDRDELTQERIESTRANRRKRELEIAEKKRLLIPRALAVKQLSYRLLALRQRLLALPASLAGEVAECKGDTHAITNVLDNAIRDALRELADAPQRVSDPDWLKRVR
jgi:hypothetical protein